MTRTALDNTVGSRGLRGKAVNYTHEAADVNRLEIQGQVRFLSHNQAPGALTIRLCPRELGISEDRGDDEPNSHISWTI